MYIYIYIYIYVYIYIYIYYILYTMYILVVSLAQNVQIPPNQNVLQKVTKCANPPKLYTTDF